MTILLGFCIPAFSGDKDRDGIPNKYDECRTEKEDFDDFEDQDGCPDYDNDKDGIPDERDKCPEKPEDKDGFEDLNGCPDPDNDKDGIPDNKDKCPDKPEDFDAFEDMDGCPDTDNDKDGVADAHDKCPAASEDKDGFKDKDGCPDPDNDKDGIKDKMDKCPNEAETINQREDEDGCPDSDVPPIKESLVYPDVKFRTGTDELTFESFRSLDSLAKKLSIYRDKQVKILIYSIFAVNDSTSLALLDIQHKALINYLVSKGASQNQIAPGDFSIEAYEKIKGTPEDFNQKKSIEVRLTTFDPDQITAPQDTLQQKAVPDSVKKE
jgi:outer membrane protein OmpA-like peptidoglycan-associated protein